jgi:hypothetical protein
MNSTEQVSNVPRGLASVQNVHRADLKNRALPVLLVNSTVHRRRSWSTFAIR